MPTLSSKRILAWLLLSIAPASASGLYEAQTIVTGMDARSRPAGLAACLGLVLAKVAGDPDLAADPRVAGLAPDPLLAGLAYLDRMSDQPKHDEQGTRDRPYDLLARFTPAGIDAALRSLGRTPWPGPRPDIVVELTIQPRTAPALALRADTDPDERHRAALLAAADRAGLAVLLQPAAGPPPRPGPDAARLGGTLRWSDADFGWVGQWRLDWRGQVHEWGIAGVGFDAAYRDAMGGAARFLSTAQPSPRQ